MDFAMCSARHVPLRLLATALSFAAAVADSPPEAEPELHQPEAQPEAAKHAGRRRVRDVRRAWRQLARGDWQKNAASAPASSRVTVVN